MYDFTIIRIAGLVARMSRPRLVEDELLTVYYILNAADGSTARRIARDGFLVEELSRISCNARHANVISCTAKH